MVFDKIIGNPPYYRSTHLHIMSSAQKHLNKDGELVFLHPARWIEDKIAVTGHKNENGKGHIVDYTRFVPIFKDTYESVVIYKAEDIPYYFDIIQFPVDLMISKLSLKKHNRLDLSQFCWKDQKEKSIFNKLEKYKSIQHDMIFIDYKSKDLIKQGQYGVYVPGVAGNPGHKCWSTFLTKTFEKPITYTPKMKGGWLKVFNTEIEAINFIKYLNSDFARTILVMVKTNIKNDDGNMKIIPELSDYKSEISYDIFKKYNLDKDEKDYLQKLLKKYEN